MTKNLQSIFAGWAATCVTMSMVVPIAMWLTIMGVSSWVWNTFTAKCVGLSVLMITTHVLLDKMRKGSFAFVRLGWLIASIYFGVVAILVAQFFEDLGPTLFLAAPEVIGAVICSAGFVHACMRVPQTQHKSEQHVGSDPPELL
jgi:vacuolar-type H+-ATPase subunit I/STV1